MKSYPKKKTKSKSYWKKRAWQMFSKWIRLSHTDKFNQFIECYTCGIRKAWDEMDTGHGIEGRNNAVLFMEEIVKPQCKQCNIFKHGNLRVFTLKLLDELGHSRYKQLLDKSNQTEQYKAYQLEDIYETYKKKVEGLSNKT